MNEAEKEIFDFINDFRSSPAKSSDFISRCILAIKKLNPTNPSLSTFSKLLEECPNIPSSPRLLFSEKLSKIAFDFLSTKIKKNEVKDCFLQGNQLKGIIPDCCLSNMTTMVVDEEFESVDTFLIKLLTKTDTKKKLGHNYVTDSRISEMGIALVNSADENEEENTCLCIIFNEGFIIDNVDLTELRLAYDALNPENKPNVNIKEIVSILKKEGKNKSEATLYKILEDLSKEYDVVSWPIFAKFCHKKMSDVYTKEGLERIFKIFLNESDLESIDYSQLKDINNKLNLGYTDDDIKNMLRNGTESQYGINYNDFCIRVNEKLNS